MMTVPEKELEDEVAGPAIRNEGVGARVLRVDGLAARPLPLPQPPPPEPISSIISYVFSSIVPFNRTAILLPHLIEALYQHSYFVSESKFPELSYSFHPL